VLIGVYDKIITDDVEKVMRIEWARKKRQYQENHDCVTLMNYIAFKLTYFAEHMRHVEDKLPGTWRDDCPGRHVRTLISPNGETDWSRAVWCIYSAVQQKGFDKAWNFDVLAQMEAWLERHASPSALSAEHAFNPDPRADMPAMRGLLAELAGLIGSHSD
jgi:hypothetical protein